MLSTGDLPVGTRNLAVTVADSDGVKASAEVEIEVIERTTPTRHIATPDPAVVELLTGGKVSAGSEPAQAVRTG